MLVSLREDVQDTGISEQQKHLIRDVIDLINEHWQDGHISETGHHRINVCMALAMQSLTSSANEQTLREHLYLLADVLDEQVSQHSSSEHTEEAILAS